MSRAQRRNRYATLINLSGYHVANTLGRGVYGYVYQCVKLDTMEEVAVKVVPKQLRRYGQSEVNKHKKLKALEQDIDKFIKFRGYFEVGGNVFMEFEKLDMTVEDMIKRFERPLHLSEIQLITKQMLEALNILKSIGLVHTDIKLDNIMLINHELHPFKVKLIDFGLARYVSEMSPGENILPLAYRAPEVTLGLPVNEAVDMWALGCSMATMFIDAKLYPGDDEMDKMEAIVQLHGRPSDHLLNAGIYTNKYFYKDKDCPNSSWKLKTNSSWETLSENSVGNSEDCDQGKFSPRNFTSLDDIAMTRPGTAELKDTRAFLSILRQMLEVDPEKRITPSEALRHPFITMKDFPSDLFHLEYSPSHKKTKKPPKAAKLENPDARRSRDTLTNRTAAKSDNRPSATVILKSAEPAEIFIASAPSVLQEDQITNDGGPACFTLVDFNASTARLLEGGAATKSLDVKSKQQNASPNKTQPPLPHSAGATTNFEHDKPTADVSPHGLTRQEGTSAEAAASKPHNSSAGLTQQEEIKSIAETKSISAETGSSKPDGSQASLTSQEECTSKAETQSFTTETDTRPDNSLASLIRQEQTKMKRDAKGPKVKNKHKQFKNFRFFSKIFKPICCRIDVIS